MTPEHKADGGAAFRAGYGSGDNPHPAKSEAARAWHKSWRQAEEAAYDAEMVLQGRDEANPEPGQGN